VGRRSLSHAEAELKGAGGGQLGKHCMVVGTLDGERIAVFGRMMFMLL
jgi:hypothetical protein